MERCFQAEGGFRASLMEYNYVWRVMQWWNFNGRFFHGVAVLRFGVYGVPASLFMRAFWEGSFVRLSSLFGGNAQNLRHAVAVPCFPA